MAERIHRLQPSKPAFKGCATTLCQVLSKLIETTSEAVSFTVKCDAHNAEKYIYYYRT